MFKKNIKKVLVFSIITAILAFAVLAVVSSFKSPTLCQGQWTSCANANADDANRATAAVTATTNKTGIWNNYGFSIGNGAIISNVTVRADFFASNTRGFIKVIVSGDNGSTYGSSHTVGGNTAEQTFIIDVFNDLSWTPAMLNNGKLVVNVTCFKSPTGGTNPTCNLDWVPVNVTYTPFDYSMSSNPTNGSVAQARSVTSTITSTLVSGNSQTVTLTASNCPSGASCNLNTSSGTPTFAALLTVTAGASTPVGTYTINVSGSGDGVARLTTFTLNVTDSKPVANASANPTSGVAPLTVNFTGSVTGGDAPLTYFWNFKDGFNATEANPQHTFSASATYNVTFTATDFDGDSSTSAVIVTVS